MLRIEMVTRTLIMEEGHVEPRIIKLEDIHVPKQDKSSGNNPTRYELDGKNVLDLQVALMHPDWSKPLMAVKEIKGGRDIGGKTYYYELVTGFHRFEALTKNHTIEWMFDVYDFTGKPELESLYQVLENDHAPAKKMDKAGLANWLQYQVEKGFIERTESAMNKKVEILKYVHPQTKTAAVNLAVNATGAYKDVTTRSIKELKEHLDNPHNYRDDKRPRYTHSGRLDSQRLEFGWTVLEGYEDEFLFNAIKSWHKTSKAGTGRTSYFLGHVKTPKKGTVNDSRKGMLKRFSELEGALQSTLDYKEKNGNWPWRVESFFKQDNHPDSRETYWIDPPK